MKQVTILGLDHSMATTLFGPMDIFNQAGRLWNRIQGRPQTPLFDVKIASADGRPIPTANRVEVHPHCSVDQIEATDLIIIASATPIEKILAKSPTLPDWLRHHHDRGAHLASICTGVFLLAETGLLDGKSATLHWGFTREFQQRYPHIPLEPDKIFLDHGRLYCSAGVTAGMDLSLYLVEKFCGAEAARQSAKTMILAMDRHSQAPYQSVPGVRSHTDPLVAQIQAWLADHTTQTVDYNHLARTFNLSRRSLERRFKNATGTTPLAHLHALKVDQAKAMLETGGHTFNEITHAVGYEDVAFFRKLFTRTTGLRPREYQQKFAGYTRSQTTP